MTSTEPFQGAVVEVSLGRGVVRFYGATSFAAGQWVGIELSEPKGKNDGSVNGVSYFSCRPNYGVFMKPRQVKVVGVEVPQPAPNHPPPSAVRPVSHRRTPSTGIASTASFRSPPGSSRSISPMKPSTSVSSTSLLPGARISRIGQGSPPKRLSGLSLQPRKSFARQSPGLESTAPPSPSALPIRNFGSPAEQPSSVSPSGQPSRPPSTPPPIRTAVSRAKLSPPLSKLPNQQERVALRSVASPRSPTRPPSSPILPAVQDDQELQELRAKIRVSEAKRADDARRIRELETRLSEAESFVALRPKLQAKLTSQQTELIATRRELADALQLSQLAESRILDAQEQLEMAMLDKEVADEKAELAQAELAEVTEKFATMEVELGVLREPRGGEGGGGDVKGSLAYIQLEKQNERLKEALIRLRDLSHETEQEQRRRILEMEKDVTGVDELQSQYESTLIKLTNAETQIEDLKLQLDDALGAEDLLVQLTERNLMLGEKIEEMRITIEDLEAIKELNDEIEEDHVETEKSLQKDLDMKDVQIREQTRRVEILEENCQDLESTINQFRDLVLQLQSEVDILRSQTQTAQHESATAASQTAAVMSLNLKLQSNASKNQAKNIELEIKKLEAKETRELLSIVQPYLPQLYVESDSDATSCYLFLQRLAYKTELINVVVAQAHGLPESLNGEVSDVLVGVCEMRARLAGLSVLCRRFAAVLRRCDPESFLTIGRIYPEVAPMEKRIDMHIDLLRRDEFREEECVADVIKMQAQFDHLAETYFDGFEFDLAERELACALSFDHELDVFAAAIALTKTSVAAIIRDEDTVLDMGGLDIDTELFQPLQRVFDLYKTAKTMSKKLTKRLDDLIQESSALKSNLIPQLKSLSNMVPEIVNFGISLAQQIMPHLSDARSSKSPFQLASVLTLIGKIAASTVAKDKAPGISPCEALCDSISQLIQECGNLLPLAMEAENVMKVSGTAPWVLRIAEIKASTAINVEAEGKVAQLNDEMQGLARTLKVKEQAIQESVVKIELMERRMEAVKKQADTIADLEAELSSSKKQKRVYEEAMEQLQTDLDTLEQDNAKLKAMTNAHERQISGNQPVETEHVQIEGSLETSYLLDQIDALRGTVRFLRTENSYLKGQDLLKELQALPPLPETSSRPPTPLLHPSGMSESEDSDSDSDIPYLPPTLHSLEAETKSLFRHVVRFSSSRVVDLSVLHAKRSEAHNGKFWLSKKQTPAYHVLERKLEAERLSRKVQDLLDRTNVISGTGY